MSWCSPSNWQRRLVVVNIDAKGIDKDSWAIVLAKSRGNPFVDTVFGHVSMIGKSIDQQNKAVVFYLQDELPMRMVADEGGVERD